MAGVPDFSRSSPGHGVTDPGPSERQTLGLHSCRALSFCLQNKDRPRIRGKQMDRRNTKLIERTLGSWTRIQVDGAVGRDHSSVVEPVILIEDG